MAEEKEGNKRRSDEFIVGSKDPQGTEIVRIYGVSPEYVIYRTGTGLRVFTDEDEIPPEKRVYSNRFMEIGDELAKIYSLQPEELAKVESINKQIARAMHQCLEGKIEKAKFLLKEAESRLLRLRRLQGRIQYLTAASVGLMVLLLGLAVSVLCGSRELTEYLNVVVCGAIGGFLSVALNVWSLDIDPDASKELNILAGASRMVIAALAGIVAYFAVMSNLVFGALVTGGGGYGLYMAATVAGFSESFVPNLIGNISSDKTED